MIGKHSADFNTKYHNSETAGRRFAAKKRSDRLSARQFFGFFVYLRRMKRIMLTLTAITAVIITALAAYTPRDIPNVHLADRTRYVSNPDGVLSPAAETRLDSLLAGVWRSTSAEVTVVAVDSIEGDDIDSFATELFSLWGIGKKDNDNGLLILIARAQRRAVLRTGYGLEGPLPDAICGRIIRNDMAPHFRNGDYDGGTIAAVASVADRLGAPDVADEIRSRYPNDSRTPRHDEDYSGLIDWLATMAAVMTAIALAIYLWRSHSTRRMPTLQRYQSLKQTRVPLLCLSALGVGVPLIVIWLLNRKMKRVRDHARNCPNCGKPMEKLPEDKDNDYLTPAQDTEERINSVDYDVWLCRACGETDIIPYVNDRSAYTVCPRCNARACQLTADRIVIQPTVAREGQGVKVYTCCNCGFQNNRPYRIQRRQPPVVIIPPGGGSGFGSGGGFSGGSFGGGMTGGGGASGGW